MQFYIAVDTLNVPGEDEVQKGKLDTDDEGG